MGPNSKAPKPKSEPRSVKPAARQIRKLEKRAAQSDSGGRDRNDYLATLLDPVNAKGVGIPDAITIPSSKFQTQHVHAATTPSGCTFGVWAFKPTIYNGILRCGARGTTGALTLMYNSSGTDLVNNSAAVVYDIVPQGAANAMATIYSSIRPVSMQIEFVPTSAMLTATGLVGGTVLDANQLPCKTDTSASLGGGPFQNASGVTSVAQDINELVDILKADQPITKGLKLLWKPQDGSTLNYVMTCGYDADPSYVQPVPDAVGYRSMSFVNTETLNTDSYYLPFPVQATEPGDYTGNFVVTPHNNYPQVLVAIMGAPTAATTYGEFVCTINWEAVPIAGSVNLIATTPSPSNPTELAHAENVLTMVPPAAKVGDPTDPGIRIQNAAKSSASDIYNPSISPKAAVEGTSVWEKIKPFAKLGLGLLSPLASAVPGVGPALALGGGALAAAL